MLRAPVVLVLACVFGVPAHGAAPVAADLRVDVDWPAFLARQDLVWSQVPARWGDGAFTGNGLLGTMMFTTDDGRHPRWHVGRSDVVLKNARLNDVNIRVVNRIPIGDLVLAGAPRTVRLRQDLWNAEVTGEGPDGMRIRSFTAASPSVHVIELTGVPGRFAWEPALPLDPRLVYDHEQLTNADRSPTPDLDTSGPVAVSVQTLHDGGEHATAWLDRKIDDRRRVLFLSVGFAQGTPGAARREAVEAVTAAAEAGLDKLVADHRAWWHAYWPKSFVSIPDTRLESFYWIQMYKLASATRADRPMIDLMGPWFDRTPWPRIWWNLNAQLTYWPVLGANRLELGESLLKTIDSCGPALAANAAPWSDDSSAIGRTSSYDCVGPATRELCNLPWALHNYWLHYRHTMDDAMLRERILPVLRRSMSFYLHMLVEGPDGRLHLPRGMSPEYDGRSDHPDTAIDIGLLRWGLETIVEANERLRLDDPRGAEWRRVLEKLTPFAVDDKGLRVSADTPYASSHRHYSHLFPIFPLYLLRWDRPEDRDLITRSFDHWLSMPERFRGYSWTGAASIAASIGRPDDAIKYLRHLLDQPQTPILPNTMYREAGPVIETPLSAASSLHDLLLQSWGGVLRVFPGVGAAWKDVAFHDLRTQGAFLVSAVRRDGRTRFVRIESLAGVPCVVFTGMSRVRATPDRPMRQRPDGAIELTLAKGESVLLTAEGESGPAVVAPVKPLGPVNSYGVP